MKQLPKTLFGVGKAASFLVDTLNELQRPKVTAKCMAMISSSRAWQAKFSALVRTGVITLQDVGNLVRLYKTEQGERYAAWNKQLDEDLETWTPLLTSEALHSKTLEARAYKLAMNISMAATKQAGSNISRMRIDQLRRDKQLRVMQASVRRETDGQMDVEAVDRLKLTPEQNLAVLKIVRQALRKPT